MTASGHTAQSQPWSTQRRTRPGAAPDVMAGIVIALAALSAVMGMMFACGVLGPEPQIVAAIHTIAPESVSAEEIARQYGWRGDWRDYMEQMRRLNGWDSWPFLHAGEKIIVPDYRDHGGRAVGRGRRTPPIANQDLLAKQIGESASGLT